jgi:hypothetical protein
MSLKNLFLNTAAISYDANNDQGVDPKIALREQISKGNLPKEENEENKDGEKNEETQEGNEEENNDGDGEEEDKEEKLEETAEAKAEREAAEKIAAKAKRKDDRMQRRIDEAIAAKKTAEDELKKFKEANPDVKLTEEEVEAKAEAKAAAKLAAKQAEDIQAKFDNACAKLAKDATKIDKDFDDKVNDMAEQFGPIPSFMIGVLEDFENGAEVLASIVNDDEVAEKIYNLKTSPAKMTRELVAISNKLIEDKKKPRKQISKVEIPVEPVNGNRHVSTTITEADTKNMDSYVAKRRMQQEAARKARGW